jgi:hypothetical protein
MTPVGVARALPPFWLGFDCEEPATDAMIADAVSRGFRFVGRYVNNLDAAERDRIFAQGLGILPYTFAFVTEPMSAATGELYGGHMASVCIGALSMPPTVHVAIDLEKPAAGSLVAPHVNAFSRKLEDVGLGPALYVGVPQPATSVELFRMIPNRYIKGGGRIVDAGGALAEPACGWCCIQLEPLDLYELGGVRVDVEVSKLDYEDRALTLWWPR